MNIGNPISREVGSVSFSFYRADEVRRLSVKQLTNPTLFDAMGFPVSGGLYDMALGPINEKYTCKTCRLAYHHCPGHFGHIELASPCYNPMLFKTMQKLLSSTCQCCHHLRMPETTVAHFAAKLQLIYAGLVLEAQALDSALALKGVGRAPKDGKAAGAAQDADDEENDQDDDQDDDGDAVTLRSPEQFLEALADYVQQHFARLPRRSDGRYATPVKTTLMMDAIRRIERRFMHAVSPGGCPRCRAHSPKFRAEGQHKLFQRPIPSKQQSVMRARGQVLPNVLAEERAAAAAAAKEALAKETPAEVEVADMAVDMADAPETAPAPSTAETAPPASGRYVSPFEVRAHLKRLWSNEREILDLLYGSVSFQDTQARETPYLSKESTPDMFFVEALPVTPSKFRPVSQMNDMVYEHPQNFYLAAVLRSNQHIFQLRHDRAALRSAVERRANDASTVLAAVELQTHVNYLVDSAKAPLAAGKQAPPGIRQLLEKKEGLFRKHMMGKRVNFAARSVISPDPNIETSEIGIPPVFARKLTYPERVTTFNYKELAKMVTNGPHVWPGATHVEHENGVVVNLELVSESERVALANALLTPSAAAEGGEGRAHASGVNKIVRRHLRNGDFLLLNRQPTLHKPSIMAHTARVLPGEKTIRMHYANCNTYNADFDGDEMNIHFPQTDVGRAEAMLIARTDEQYLVPTDGGVLRGLIQDHVDAGVHMTCKDTWLSREDYLQLVYVGLRPEGGLGGLGGARGDGHGCIEPRIELGLHGRVVLLEPALIKPVRRWSGKQVISTVLVNLTAALAAPLNIEAKARVAARLWGATAPEEQAVQVVDGELVTGVLDKSQIGASAFGLVHAVYEVYGARFAGELLSIFGRLFTAFFQLRAFSCRMDDLRLTGDGERTRRALLDGGRGRGREAALEYAQVDEARVGDAEAALRERLGAALRSPTEMAALDSAVKGKVNSLTSSVIDACLPAQLLRAFPHNNMMTMIASGAKGSNVNLSQITCLLGQQELEGRRVPVMVSGKSLPSFRPFETLARAGGFIGDRFLTGVRPQEYFFHCMAGREGLIDTAVKTSRSGYLQRCLVKHLEGIRSQYDHTVRDEDGSVIQFLYGEDALDVTRQKYLWQFGFGARNFEAFVRRNQVLDVVGSGHVDLESAMALHKKVLKKPHKHAPLLAEMVPSRHLGSVSDRFLRELAAFEATAQMPRDQLKKFRSLMMLRYLGALVQPGEAVGVLAAQSIGEPSTQMTLNTFHFAGFGAKNVTLGIPRLREIIMTASASIKTPVMTLPARASLSRPAADALAKQISRLVLADIMLGVRVSSTVRRLGGGDAPRCREYTVRLELWSSEDREAEYGVDDAQVETVVERRFVPLLEQLIAKEFRKSRAAAAAQSRDIGRALGSSAEATGTTRPATGDDGDNAPAAAAPETPSESDEPDEGDEGDDATASKRRRRAETQAAYAADASESSEAEEAEAEGEDGKAAEEEEDEDDHPKPAKTLTPQKLSARDRIVQAARYVTDYRVRDGYCEIDLRFPADSPRLLLVGLAERACQGAVVHQVGGIAKSYVMANELASDSSIKLATEGVNLRGMWELDDEIDLNRVYTNDIAAILRTYGVEAARNAIMREVAGVFDVYGINVDKRHLSLIADYMTFEGGYKPFNRTGMMSNPSPFTQMSYETTAGFLTTATLSGDYDSLTSPSSRIVMGQVVRGGTGSFTLAQSTGDLLVQDRLVEAC